jgi:hypothetical protein
MKNFTMGLGEQRKQNALTSRKPLRTAREMAEELGLTRQTLAAYIGHYDGPAPVFISGTSRNRNKNTWYDPEKIRDWWEAVQPKIKHTKKTAIDKRRKAPAPTTTRAFLAQQWLREHGPATQRQLVEAGFINMSAGMLLKMIGFGALIKEKQNGRVTYTATDKDYLKLNGRSHYDTPTQIQGKTNE